MTFEGDGCEPVIRGSRMRRAAKIVIPAGAALGAGAAIATAAIPAADGTITACYKPGGAGGPTGGSVRFVDTANSCVGDSGEVALSWNQKGQAGPTGATGATGPEGPAGPAGPAGASAVGAKSFPAAASDYLLDLDGIKGESKDQKHAGTIDIESFSWGVTHTSNGAHGGGGGAGKVKFHDISFKKQVDKASPLLFKACATGEHIKKATLYVRKAGGNQQEYLRVTLTDVLVSSYKTGAQAPAGDGETESITLNFAKVSVEYIPTNPDGSSGAPVKAGWDVKANKGA